MPAYAGHINHSSNDIWINITSYEIFHFPKAYSDNPETDFTMKYENEIKSTNG